MRVVHKFRVFPAGEVMAACHAPVILFAEQAGEPRLWIEVDTELEVMRRRFLVVGTGHPVPNGGKHCGSCVAGAFVWHLYEVTP